MIPFDLRTIDSQAEQDGEVCMMWQCKEVCDRVSEDCFFFPKRERGFVKSKKALVCSQ